MAHYFEATSLPALRFEEPPEASFQEVMELYRLNLSPDDLEQVKVVRRLVDLYNLCAFWREEELDPRGNLTQVEMEESLLGVNGLPEYVLEWVDSHEEPLREHGELIVEFFRHEIAGARGFLRHWLEFEREWRLVMVGFRSKRLGRDPAVELQYEDPSDDLVAHIIAQRDADHYEPPEGFEVLKGLFADHADAPEELHRELSRFRFNRVDAMLEEELFSLGFLLGYMVQLMILEDLRR